MITPDVFPYITALHVNDCYTYKDFDIQLHDYKPFSHLILTGKNGSGKSTILRSTYGVLTVTSQYNDRKVRISQNPIYDYQVNLNVLQGVYYTFFQAKRESNYHPVSGPTRMDKFNSFYLDSKTFLQYLVNKKIDQAFAQIDGKLDLVKINELFFLNLENLLTIAFEENVKLEFIKDSYDFKINLNDGRTLNFQTLPEGFSALSNIILDLLIRTDLVRKQVEDYTYNPCGIVLIDEPETHLHLELQEQVLPLLTDFFPNIQFICATHSPAVIASIKNATIFDLTTKETRTSEDAVGRSYSELMVSHFGLENTYSSIADEIIEQINAAVMKYENDVDELKNALEKIAIAHNQYLSPSLQMELELLIAKAEAKQAIIR